MVQAYAYGKYLGYLNVTFDKKGNVVEAVGNPILLDSSVPEGMWNRRLNLPAALYCNSSVIMLNTHYSVEEESGFLPELAVLLCIGFRLCYSCTCLHLVSFSEQWPLNMHKFSVCFCLFKMTESPFVRA